MNFIYRALSRANSTENVVYVFGQWGREYDVSGALSNIERDIVTFVGEYKYMK